MDDERSNGRLITAIIQTFRDYEGQLRSTISFFVQVICEICVANQVVFILTEDDYSRGRLITTIT